MRTASAAAAAALVLALAASGCGSEPYAQDGVRVVATTTQLADFVLQVGGDRVDVHRLLPPNADPHDYEPRPSDARAVGESDLVLRSGGEVDAWLGDLIAGAGGDRDVVTLTDALGLPEDGDPHWWQDPRNAIAAAEAIGDALARTDPGGAATYRRRAAAYGERLRRLDRGIAACIARIPPDQRKLVTTHDALGFFARRYGLELLGAVIPSRTTQAQPSAGATQKLVERIRREDVRAIFPESALDPRLERAIAQEAGARVGRKLWTDSLGPPGSDGATYLEAMASNTAALVEGLTGGERSCRPRPG